MLHSIARCRSKSCAASLPKQRRREAAAPSPLRLPCRPRQPQRQPSPQLQQRLCPHQRAPRRRRLRPPLQQAVHLTTSLRLCRASPQLPPPLLLPPLLPSPPACPLATRRQQGTLVPRRRRRVTPVPCRLVHPATMLHRERPHLPTSLRPAPAPAARRVRMAMGGRTAAASAEVSARALDLLRALPAALAGRTLWPCALWVLLRPRLCVCAPPLVTERASLQ